MKAKMRRAGFGLRRDEGAQLVEFAFILPVLLLLVLGIINFGFEFGQQLSLNQGTREGARQAVVTSGATQSQVQGIVQNALGGLISPKTDVDVTVEREKQNTDGTFGPSYEAGTCADYTRLGGQLRVTAVYPAADNSWLIYLPLGIGPPQLKATATYRCELIS